MRIITYVNENAFWIDVLRALEAKGVEIGYVVGSPPGLGTFQDAIRKAFPSAGYHDHYAANRGDVAEPGFADHALDFDRAARTVWEEDGHRVIDMFTRMDCRDDFSYRDRRDLFHSHLRLADYLMQRYRLDGLVTSIACHDPFLYVLERLMRRRHKHVASFVVTNFDCRFFPRTEEGEQELRSRYERLLAEGRTEARLPPRLQADFARIRGVGKQAMTRDFQYVEGWTKAMFAVNRGAWAYGRELAHGTLLDIRDALKPAAGRPLPFPTRFEKETGRAVASSFKGFMARVRHEWWSVGNRRIGSRLSPSYARHARPPALDQPYVFVALSYQPELSSNPLGGPFSNQMLMLDTLRASLPAGWQLVVKEHPSQHNPNFMFSCQGRRPPDYAFMASLPNVTLAPMSMSSAELIASCRAVATISGTAGWEALLRGKPILAFGEAWYRFCKGAWAVRDVAKCREALAAIAAGATGDPLAAELYAEAIESFGLQPYVGKDGDWAPWVIQGCEEADRDNCVERYADAFAAMLATKETVAP